MALPFGFKFTVDGRSESAVSLAFQGRLMEVVDAKRARLEAAYPRAMAKGVTEPGKRALRGTIEASGFYRAGALAKTWRAFTYPPGRPSLEPAAFFKTRAALIVNAFEDGVTITVHNAQFLAIPEGPAKGIIHRLNRGRTSEGRLHNEDNPVARVAAALGVELVPIISRDGRQGVLVAADARKLTRAGRDAKRQTGRPTALFALVRSATLKRRPMGREVLEGLKGSYAGRFAGALAAELGSEEG
jgi:hypothetical protein